MQFSDAFRQLRSYIDNKSRSDIIMNQSIICCKAMTSMSNYSKYHEFRTTYYYMEEVYESKNELKNESQNETEIDFSKCLNESELSINAIDSQLGFEMNSQIEFEANYEIDTQLAFEMSFDMNYEIDTQIEFENDITEETQTQTQLVMPIIKQTQTELPTRKKHYIVNDIENEENYINNIIERTTNVDYRAQLLIEKARIVIKNPSLFKDSMKIFQKYIKRFNVGLNILKMFIDNQESFSENDIQFFHNILIILINNTKRIDDLRSCIADTITVFLKPQYESTRNTIKDYIITKIRTVACARNKERIIEETYNVISRLYKLYAIEETL